MTRGCGLSSFDIAQVMAGAVSAGTYTAGVVDFLQQGLDRCSEAKPGGPTDVPWHDAGQKVLAGTSTDEIVAATVAALAGKECPLVDDFLGRWADGRNKLFDGWVNKLDIARLLKHPDLDCDVMARSEKDLTDARLLRDA